ncbi:hypothetical protein WFO77_07445 [Yersinia enterocolitica]|uniref:Uncharacterized protein n=1 Tax=Yersinia enterocolitica TaxID=630 RepID=A0AAD2UYI2_YEREN|nr:hypothetical protein [Yersinia enterocolitica]ELI8101577.1 hypothetical protein [Yersinia enterocolitica]HDL7145352.1 hypothetical protein [Yersinia enterocolitica]HDL7687740.1 hypothetical protein [Yersinia enterocolitica]HDL7791386.1 hypothetical protein [Yersinia enterocolitica]
MFKMITAVSVVVLSFTASAAQLPEQLMDKDNPGESYWCQGNDINSSICSLSGVSDDHKFALIQDWPGTACADNNFGVIDLVHETGINVPYDGGDCQGDVKAGFMRDKKDNGLYVKIVRGSKTLLMYKVKTGY